MILGWDVSTAIVGFVAISDDGKSCDFDYCDLRKIEDHDNKGDLLRDFVRKKMLLASGSSSVSSVHFIEDKLAGFSGGGSNAGTIMRLGAFNYLAGWLIHDIWGSQIERIHPSTVKAAMRKEGLLIPKGGDKKGLTLQWVSSRERSFPMELNKNGKPQPWCYDMADAFVTALVGRKRTLLARQK